MKIIQLELFTPPPDEVLKQLELPVQYQCFKEETETQVIEAEEQKCQLCTPKNSVVGPGEPALCDLRAVNSFTVRRRAWRFI